MICQSILPLFITVPDLRSGIPLSYSCRCPLRSPGCMTSGCGQDAQPQKDSRNIRGSAKAWVLARSLFSLSKAAGMLPPISCGRQQSEMAPSSELQLQIRKSYMNILKALAYTVFGKISQVRKQLLRSKQSINTHPLAPGPQDSFLRCR